MKDVPEKKPTPDRPAGPAAPASRAGGLAPHSVQRLQGAVGNAAVTRLVAQRYTAPVKTPPSAAPGFRRVGADVAAKKRTMSAHAPAAAESKSAQDAAVAPPDDKEAQGKAANAEKMNAAKPGDFDKAAFVAAVDKAIEAQAPKNLDEADKFSRSGKADKVKEEVDGKVGEGKDTSAKDIETTTKAPPDTSAAKDKPVTPLDPDRPPANPGAPSASDAIPAKQPPAVTDFSQGPAENDKAMADAEVTEEQLAKGNEPEFDEALKAKKTAETDSAKAPGKAHTAEDQQLATAKAGAAAAGAQAMNTLTATRDAAGMAVDGGKGETKSKDERKRAEVTAKLQKVFDATKKDVEATLTGLDQKVDTAFTTGEKSARDAFTADHKARMKKYKDKRYSGFLGKGRWLKDKFAGLPKEANDLYQESRKLYVARMRTVISSVADLIGVELGRAKARIAQGRTDLKAEVDRLPADLKAFGEEASQDFAGKFEDLEASVDEKSEQLVQDLANKYTAALNAVDEEIKKLQEANKGLIDKAKDAIVGVLKTINELKNLLLGILAKAASAIMKIIKDPIGFLGNLVRAVGAGLNLFVTNIGEHLKKGLVSWLLGTATKAGLELPDRFDLRGIIQLITGLLGLTWDNIRTRITRKGVPEEAMTAVESTVPVAQSLAKEGPAGAAKHIEAETGDLKSTILSKLRDYLIPTVIIAGVTWILSLLNPASAFVRAVKGIIDIVTFVVTQGAQIADFVNAVLDAVIQIANGGAAGVPKMVETALAASIPLLIGFLASLLGIGNLANKVRSVFQAASRPVNRAIDKIVDFLAKKGKALWQKMQPGRSATENANRRPGRKEGPANKKASPGAENVIGIIREIDASRKFTSFGHVHTIRAKGESSGSLRLTLASEEEDFKKKIKRVISVLQTYPVPRKVRGVPPGDMIDRLNTSIVSAQRLQESFGAWKALERARATPDPGAANRIKATIDAWISSGSPEVVDEADIPRPTLPPGFNKHREILYEGDGNRFKRAKIAVIGRDFPGIFDDVQAVIKPFKDARASGLIPPDELRTLKNLAANKLRDMTMLGAAKDEARVPVKVLKEFKRKGDVNGRNMRAASNWNADHIVPLAAHWHAVGYNSEDKSRTDATPEISNLQLIAGDANKSAQADYEGVKYEFMKKKPGPDFKTDKVELQ
ncbi:hypothetical protein ACFYOG_06225 [Streptomyces sp. NPDC007818]|uniref:phage tail protein n=1 Tax=Streptomyces sp. NPDC007818 TaxID=3364780 RepID=UPI0036B1D01E